MGEEAKKKQTIFDITREYAELYDALYWNDGELTEEMEAALERLDKEDLPKKLEGLAFVMRDAKGEAEKADDAIRRLQARKKRYINTVCRIEEWILRALYQSHHEVIRTPSGVFEFKLGKNPPAVDVLDRRKPIPKILRNPPPAKPAPSLNRSKAWATVKDMIDLEELDAAHNGRAWDYAIKKLNLIVRRRHRLIT